MLLKNGTVLTNDFQFKKIDVAVACGKISRTADNSDAIDCTDCFIVPGLIDIHTHGALGYDGLDPSFEACEELSKYYAQNGVTTFLANVMTQSRENMLAAVKNIADAKKRGISGASIGGIYMEGPYFSDKYKGAQNPDYLRRASTEEFDEFSAACGGIIKVISIAPEKEGALDFIRKKKEEVRIFIGHTDADFDAADTAISAGASGLTHTFNGMRGFHHRTPNAVGAALYRQIFCECICDGFHLSPAAVMLIYRTVGADRLVLISDSIRPAGLPDGEYDSGGQPVTVKNGEAYLADGTIAGSSARLLDCVKKAIGFGIKPEDAFRAATLNPAKAAGLDACIGSITPGKNADLLILNKDYSIKNVIINGNIYR